MARMTPKRHVHSQLEDLSTKKYRGCFLSFRVFHVRVRLTGTEKDWPETGENTSKTKEEVLKRQMVPFLQGHHPPQP